MSDEVKSVIDGQTKQVNIRRVMSESWLHKHKYGERMAQQPETNESACAY